MTGPHWPQHTTWYVSRQRPDAQRRARALPGHTENLDKNLGFQRRPRTAPPTSSSRSTPPATTSTAMTPLNQRPARRRPAGTCASRCWSASPPWSSPWWPAAASSPPAHKNVTLTVDGQQQEVGTLAGSVEGALDSAGLTVNEHDTVAPAVDTAISDGSQIVVERGRLLTLTIDGQTQRGLDHRDHRRGGAGRARPEPGRLQAVGRPVPRDPGGRPRRLRRHALQRKCFRRRRRRRPRCRRPPRPSATC